MAKERKTITKEWLQELGINEVTEDGRIFCNGKEKTSYVVSCKHKHGQDKSYPVIGIYDPEYHQLKCKEGKKGNPGIRLILVSRIVYAWFKDICPGEYDVDHKDNNPFNNSLNNLQLLTRKENLARRPQRNQFTCKLSEEQLAEYNERKRVLKSIIAEKRNIVNNDIQKVKSLESDLHYYVELSKDLKKYEDTKDIRAEYKSKIADAKELLNEHKEDWHIWCKKLSEFNKTYLNEINK